ncbi:MAG: 50S ribosomal protein L11 methyltransferase [Gammaproteobacteria bacterium]|nr:50S ribosomal protein L11 methyltransferase [Gammaproteobacteria bacterium]NIR85829.1 50S ribosomal protein L11 methyltransferase [Gammaproteobacteria bacterium]NIR90583.1 50S ribosomal protein L11 methyltransferase [Gammaproteobacteria bacterium]NIU06964.1 50S ribosomal protein L11 methyltransferase [Gammaproteobacteria bacterium]NIV53894.1 50S ribosomal protein L11 methyltransferase [Gammaproteobacteria bacterium]
MSAEPQPRSPWQQLTLVAAPEEAARAGELLEAAGALSVTLTDAEDEPLYEPAPRTAPLWGATRVTGLFAPDADLERIQNELRACLGAPAHGRVLLETLADRVWEREWLRYARPRRIGARLWVCPSGFDPPPGAEVVVRLDPGLAFGTGAHPSTRLCLAWLEQTDLRGTDIVDYGCGSGILGIAALKLGAHRVWAVDKDPQALTAARANANANGVAHALHALAPHALPAHPVADGVVANILARPLMELAPRLTGLLRPYGWVVLAGILAEQAEAVAAAYRPWLHLRKPSHEGPWVRLVGRLAGEQPDSDAGVDAGVH